jgi:MFS family permease
VIEEARERDVGLGADFRFYASARAVSAIGDRIALIALVFLVIQLSRGFAFALGLFYLARVLPALFGGLFTGVLADHYSRRPLMVGCDVGRAAVALAVPALGGLSLWTLYPAVVALYGFGLLFESASVAALPDVVPEAAMTRANAILRAIDTSADLAYAVGGSLVYLLDLRIPFYIDAATFLFSAGMVARMAIPRNLGGPLPSVGQARALLREGLTFTRRNPFLKWSTATFAVAPLAGGAMFVLVPLYANRTLSKEGLGGPLASGAFRFSVLEVSLGLGALAGSVIAVRLASRWPRGRLFGLGILGMGCVDLLFAAIKSLYVAAPVMALHGLCNSLFLVSGVTLLQQLTPTVLRGRVVAVRSTLIYSAVAAGSVVGGLLLDKVPYSAMWLLIGSIIALSSLFVWLQPSVRNQA